MCKYFSLAYTSVSVKSALTPPIAIMENSCCVIVLSFTEINDSKTGFKHLVYIT